eukprot:708745-Rhodomonas_salina.1
MSQSHERHEVDVTEEGYQNPREKKEWWSLETNPHLAQIHPAEAQVCSSLERLLLPDAPTLPYRRRKAVSGSSACAGISIGVSDTAAEKQEHGPLGLTNTCGGRGAEECGALGSTQTPDGGGRVLHPVCACGADGAGGVRWSSARHTHRAPRPQLELMLLLLTACTLMPALLRGPTSEFFCV